MTRERLQRLAASKDCREHWNVASDPECPQELLAPDMGYGGEL